MPADDEEYRSRVWSSTWITEANKDWAGGTVHGNRLGDILRIGTGKATAVDQAQVGVLLQRKSQRSARQHLYVRTVELGVTTENGVASDRISSKHGGSSVEIGALEANTGDQADFVEINGVHHVAGADLLDEVELAGGVRRQRVIAGIGGEICGEGVIDIEKVGVGPQFVSAVIIIVIR